MPSNTEQELLCTSCYEPLEVCTCQEYPQQEQKDIDWKDDDIPF